jgi:uncharacterized membrane protein
MTVWEAHLVLASGCVVGGFLLLSWRLFASTRPVLQDTIQERYRHNYYLIYACVLLIAGVLFFLWH